MDIVYPLKRGGSRIGDNELRYSLRSVAENLKMPVGDLWIYGVLPEWLRGAKHVPMEDRQDKATNLREKYRAMCATEALSDPFLLLDDDHFFLRPWEQIPLHTKGDLKALVSEYSGTTHGRYLMAAWNRLRSEKLPTRNYQIHFPILIHKAVLRGAVGLMKFPMVMGSIYGNLLDGPTAEVTTDFRANTPEAFLERRDGPFVSFPPAVRPEWVAWLAERFPEPSRWEDRVAPHSEAPVPVAAAAE